MGRSAENLLSGSRNTSSAAAEIAAYHHKAGHSQAAFVWDLRAATAAEQVGGFAEAADCYRRMLAAWGDVTAPEQEAAADRADILTRLAQADELAGDAESLNLHLRQALALLDPAADPVRAALIQYRLG